MSEPIRRERFEFLENTQADIRLLGIPNILNPFCQFISASRMSMFNHHIAQMMIPDGVEFNKCFTGVEHNFIDYTFNASRRDKDMFIVAIIPKYQPSTLVNGLKDCPTFTVIGLCEGENGKQVMDYFTIDKYFMGSNGFGYIPEIKNLADIVPNETLFKETEIMQSPAVQGNRMCYGVNLNVVYGSFPETIEDAFIVSESAAKRLQTRQVSRVSFQARADRRPLNLHGDDFNPKFVPDIGTVIRDDGALYAARPVNWMTCVADTDPEALKNPLPLQDDIIYIEPGSRIVDLTFNINKSKLTNCYEQAQVYQASNAKMWDAIYQTYLKHKGKVELTPKMATLVTQAIYQMLAMGMRVPTLDNDLRSIKDKFDIEGTNGQPLDFLQCTVTYEVPRPTTNGTKLTGIDGSKGVVASIYPDSWMPRDEYGNVADMMIDMNSPVGRNNPSQFYEQGINFISSFVERKAYKVRETEGTEQAFELLMEWSKDVNPDEEKLYRLRCKDAKARKTMVNDLLSGGIYKWIQPFMNTLCPTDEDKWNALRNMRDWARKWEAKKSRIRYKTMQADGTGKEYHPPEEFVIASKYVLVLHKIPEIFAGGTTQTNHLGLPTKSSFESAHFPVTVNPTRYGEDELRMMSMDCDIREVVRLLNLQANAPQAGVGRAISTILLSDTPMNIPRIPVSNGDLQRGSAVHRLFHSLSATLGMETFNTKLDPADVPQELMEIMENFDIPDLTSADVFTDGEDSTSKKKTRSGS